MNPLRVAAAAVQLVCDLFAPVEKMHPWPDGEQPLIDEPPIDDGLRSNGTFGRVEHMEIAGYEPLPLHANCKCDTAAFEPMPGWFRGGFDEESSASSGSASLAGVDPEAEGPTPGAAHTPGVGQPSVTAALRVSAAIGLREYADGGNCEAPTFWRNIADQLDPK